MTGGINIPLPPYIDHATISSCSCQDQELRRLQEGVWGGDQDGVRAQGCPRAPSLLSRVVVPGGPQLLGARRGLGRCVRVPGDTGSAPGPSAGPKLGLVGLFWGCAASSTAALGHFSAPRGPPGAQAAQAARLELWLGSRRPPRPGWGQGVGARGRARGRAGCSRSRSWHCDGNVLRSRGCFLLQRAALGLRESSRPRGSGHPCSQGGKLRHGGRTRAGPSQPHCLVSASPRTQRPCLCRTLGAESQGSKQANKSGEWWGVLGRKNKGAGRFQGLKYLSGLMRRPCRIQRHAGRE